MEPTAPTTVATPPATTTTMASAWAQRRLRSRSSFLSSARIGSPVHLRRGATCLIPAHSGDLAVSEGEHPIGDILDASIVRYDERGGAKLRIDAQQGLDHLDTRLGVQRAGRLVAQKYLRPFGDSSRDRDTLLLAA